MPTKNPGPKRTKFERDRDFAVMAKFYLEGRDQTEIAEILNADRPYALSQQTISNDLKAVRKDWLNTAVENYDRTKEIELIRIEEDEKRILDAWELSRIPRKTVTIETRSDDTTERTVQEKRGDTDALPPLPSGVLLSALDRCRARRCAILGFTSYQKSEDLNAAIWLVLQAGYEISDPTRK